MRMTDARSRARSSLVSLAVAYTLLAIAGVAALAFLGRDGTLGGMAALNPFGPPDVSRQFFAANAGAVRVGALFCFASSIPLVIYAASFVARLECLGARGAGVYSAFAGGLAASGGLAAAGLFLWVLSVPEISASPAVARALHFLVFLCGGPAFAVGMGLLAGGASAAGRIAGVLPRWVVRFGLVLAATGALSVLGLVSLPITVAIPVTRVGGFAWLIAAGAVLPGRPA